jgi:hypothetical protein
MDLPGPSRGLLMSYNRQACFSVKQNSEKEADLQDLVDD